MINSFSFGRICLQGRFTQVFRNYQTLYTAVRKELPKRIREPILLCRAQKRICNGNRKSSRFLRLEDRWGSTPRGCTTLFYRGFESRRALSGTPGGFGDHSYLFEKSKSARPSAEYAFSLAENGIRSKRVKSLVLASFSACKPLRQAYFCEDTLRVQNSPRKCKAAFSA